MTFNHLNHSIPILRGTLHSPKIADLCELVDLLFLANILPQANGYFIYVQCRATGLFAIAIQTDVSDTVAGYIAGQHTCVCVKYYMAGYICIAGTMYAELQREHQTSQVAHQCAKKPRLRKAALHP